MLTGQKIIDAINEQIAIVKEKAAAANVAALATDLEQLQAAERRYRPEIAALAHDSSNYSRRLFPTGRFAGLR